MFQTTNQILVLLLHPKLVCFHPSIFLLAHGKKFQFTWWIAYLIFSRSLPVLQYDLHVFSIGFFPMFFRPNPTHLGHTKNNRKRRVWPVAQVV